MKVRALLAQLHQPSLCEGHYEKSNTVSVTQYDRVLVRNTGHEPLHLVTPQHAIRMLHKKKAIVLLYSEDKMFGKMPYPVELILIRPISMGWYYSKTLQWSKSGIMRRDGRKCAYCRGPADTIDHVWPQDKGGKSTWENTVAACFKCNNKKSNKTLAEMGWSLPFTPGYPRRDQLIDF